MEYSLFLAHISNPSLKKKLQTIQNQGIRLTLGYRNSTPINVLHAESKIAFLNLRIQLLADKFILNLITIKDTPLLQKIKELDDKLRISDRYSSTFPIIKAYRQITNIIRTKFKHSHTLYHITIIITLY